MLDLLNDIETLKLALAKDSAIIKLQAIEKKIKENKNLTSKIESYHTKPNQKLKTEIYQDPLYQEYISLETNINIMILELNSKLKTINNKGRCL
jgi:hypothetical protein